MHLLSLFKIKLRVTGRRFLLSIFLDNKKSRFTKKTKTNKEKKTGQNKHLAGSVATNLREV